MDSKACARMSSFPLLPLVASLPEVFLCRSICLLLRYGVLPNPRTSRIGANGSPYRRLISLRRAYRQPLDSVVPGLRGLEHDPAGKPASVERPGFGGRLSLVDGPAAGLLEGRAAYRRRAGLSCFALLRTGLLCWNAAGVVSSTTFLYEPGGSRVKGVLLGVAFLLFALGTRPTQKLYPFERLLLRLCAIAGLRFLISANDLIAFYLALEFQSFCLYILAARKRSSEFSTEAGVKYFRLGAFASGWILFGSALLYGFTGTTNFEDLQNLLGVLSWGTVGSTTSGYLGTLSLSINTFFGVSAVLGLGGVLVGRVFVFVGLLFKLAAAPFHLWAPDVYEGSPLFVTAFFAVVPKIAVLAVFVRLAYDTFGFAFTNVTQPRLRFAAAASRILGTLGGLYQTKIKRLRAYSAIGHRGYRLRARSSGTVEGVQAVFLYRRIYRLTSLGFFTVLLRVKKTASVRSAEDRTLVGSGSTEGTSLVYLSDLVEIGKRHPYLGVVIAILFFSRAGVPPLAGFFAKYYAFFAAVSAEQYALALLAVLTSTASCFYYLRVVKFRYFTGPDASRLRGALRWPSLRAIPGVHVLLVSRITRRLLLFVFVPEPLLFLAQKIAIALVA